MMIIQGLKQFPVGAKQNCFLPRQMSMMSYLNNSLLPPLSKKVVYLPLLHHTCSLKLNAGKVIWPYLQPEFSLELNSSFVNQ